MKSYWAIIKQKSGDDTKCFRCIALSFDNVLQYLKTNFPDYEVGEIFYDDMELVAIDCTIEPLCPPPEALDEMEKSKKCICKKGYFDDVWYDHRGKKHISKTICLLCKGTGYISKEKK